MSLGKSGVARSCRPPQSLVGRWVIGTFIVLLGGATVVANLIFTPPPPYSALEPHNTAQVSLIGIGDQGSGNFKQWQVAQAMERVAARDGQLDMVLLLGDNFYGKSLTGIHDWNWQMKFERVYWGRYLSHIPFYAVLGNHDYPISSDIEIDYSRQHAGSGRWQMPAHTYTKDFGSVDGRPLLRIVFLDSSVQLSDLKTQIDFMEAAFHQPDPQPVWRVVAAHHPVRNAGLHGDDARLLAELLPALRRSRVDLYLAGHDHNQQLLLRPGEPAWLISGGGGQSIYSLTAHREDVTFAASRSGFVKIDFGQARLQIGYYDDRGSAEGRFTWSRDCPWMAKGCIAAVDSHSVTSLDSP